MPNTAGQYNAYKKVSVETASQGKLVNMLFTSAIQRADDARTQLSQGKIDNVHNNLIRAQEIVAELRRALNMDMGEISEHLDRLYEYFQHLLIKGNIRKDPAPITECIELMTEMRDTWKEAFAKAEGEQTAPKDAASNARAANFEG